ncbi:hypothetical protein BKA70DRAFT_1232736 [Coprinopsis sp. MPI-PUGE-AT-0042]|nr:hypothetical protein BKA70DRAFT_1232736 [Coprinopsis sp. MPI-PUGE-AT-0042]
MGRSIFDPPFYPRDGAPIEPIISSALSFQTNRTRTTLAMSNRQQASPAAISDPGEEGADEEDDDSIVVPDSDEEDDDDEESRARLAQGQQQVDGLLADPSVDWDLVWNLTNDEQFELTTPPQAQRPRRERELANDPFYRSLLEALRTGPKFPDPETGGAKDAYVVFNGRSLGIFRTWAATKIQVDGFQSSCFKGFSTLRNARVAWGWARANNTWGTNNASHKALAAHDARQAVYARESERRRRESVGNGLSAEASTLSSPPRTTSRQPAPSKGKGKARSYTPQPTTAGPSRQAVSITASTDDSMTTFAEDEENSSEFGLLSSDLEPVERMTDKDLYFVVVRGARPGVYKGRSNADKAVGDSRSQLVFERVSQEVANQLFVDLYMGGDVIRPSKSEMF